jgi:hypothetical protein
MRRYRGRFWTVKPPNVKRLSRPNNDRRTAYLLKHTKHTHNPALSETLWYELNLVAYRYDEGPSAYCHLRNPTMENKSWLAGLDSSNIC